LINGASGGVGTFAVQIAKAFGTEVTGVCRTAKMDLVSSIGADRVIDYTREDITRTGRRYDLVLDIAAFRPASDYGRVLKPGGIYVIAGGSVGRIFQVMLLSKLGARRKRAVIARVLPEDLHLIAEMMAAGKLRSVIDKRFPLSETAEAFRHLEEGRARGKLVITVGG
jgi:NADPH:quinone reductase-like Zn-dependent oxidoreductase